MTKRPRTWGWLIWIFLFIHLWPAALIGALLKPTGKYDSLEAARGDYDVLIWITPIVLVFTIVLAWAINYPFLKRRRVWEDEQALRQAHTRGRHFDRLGYELEKTHMEWEKQRR